MTELHVPDDAARELLNLALGFRDDYGVDDNVRAIAGPVVIAELERLAARGTPVTPLELRQRAEALRGES